MRRHLDRLRDAVFGVAVLAVLVALVVGLRPDDSPGAPPSVHQCTRADCPWLDHSPEAVARAMERDRALAQIGAIDLDQLGSFTPPEHRSCELPTRP